MKRWLRHEHHIPTWELLLMTALAALIGFVGAWLTGVIA